MDLHAAVTENKTTLDYGAYVRIDNDSRFPPTTAAHPGGPWSHYALLTKNIDMLPGLSIPVMNNDSQMYVQKYGYTHDLDSLQTDSHLQTIWTGPEAYPWSSLESPVTLTASSSNTQDNTQITIQGLDDQWDQQTHVIHLNGSTPVVIPSQWRRVFRVYTSGGVATQGDVTVTITDTTVIVAHVPVEEQQTLMALYTVPRGYTAYMTGFDSTVSRNEDMLFRLRIRQPGGVFRTQHVAQVYQAPYHYKYEVYKTVSEMCDIECTGEPTNNNVSAHAAFDLILIKNS